MDNIFLFSFYYGNETEEYHFDPERLSPRAAKSVVSAQPVEDIYETFHPERTIYTGVTVGGVHTGGFHTEKAYYSYTAHGTGNGKVNIDGMSPQCIILSDQLLQEALKNPELKVNISGNTLNLQIKQDQYFSGRLKSAILSHDMSDKTSMIREMNQKCFSMSFCVAVATFLELALGGAFLTDQQRQKITTELIRSDNPRDWDAARHLMSGLSDEHSQKLVAELTEKLNGATKYKCDGHIFYDESDYTLYRWKNRAKLDQQKEMKLFGLIVAGTAIFFLILLIVCV